MQMLNNLYMIEIKRNAKQYLLNSVDRDVYKTSSNRFNIAIRHAKAEYYRNKIAQQKRILKRHEKQLQPNYAKRSYLKF